MQDMGSSTNGHPNYYCISGVEDDDKPPDKGARFLGQIHLTGVDSSMRYYYFLFS
jgi:hypothetical protein